MKPLTYDLIKGKTISGDTGKMWNKIYDCSDVTVTEDTKTKMFNSVAYNSDPSLKRVVDYYEQLVEDAWKDKTLVLEEDTFINGKGYATMQLQELLWTDDNFVYPFCISNGAIKLNFQFEEGDERGGYDHIGMTTFCIGGHTIDNVTITQAKQDNTYEKLACNLNDFDMWVPFICLAVGEDINELDLFYYNNPHQTEQTAYQDCQLVTTTKVTNLKGGYLYFYKLDKNNNIVLDRKIKLTIIPGSTYNEEL